MLHIERLKNNCIYVSPCLIVYATHKLRVEKRVLYFKFNQRAHVPLTYLMNIQGYTYLQTSRPYRTSKVFIC